jgi:glycosyltransferase involved in cell wall biosynthesis
VNSGAHTSERDNERNRTSTLRVAILGTRGIPAQYGGFETFAERLATGLVARGFDITVFCEADQQPTIESFEGVKLRYVSAPDLGPLQTILYDVRSLWAARKGYDVVYMLGYGVAPFCAIPRLWGRDVWINPDGLEWARAKWGPIARLYFRIMEWAAMYSPNRIIADCEAIAASLAQRHGGLPAHSVIPYGCDVIETPPAIEPLSQWGIVPQNYYLVVCRLEPENHVLEILQAFQRSNSNKQLVVIGNHLAETKYVALLRLVWDPRIRLIGTVYDQTKLSCLRYHSFAYLHGHSVGGTNPSLLEAMGCGNPIFAHDNPFNRETLRDSGLYFSSVLELTQIIDRADADSTSLELLREASRSRARTNYRWSSIISAYVEILEKVLPR